MPAWDVVKERVSQYFAELAAEVTRHHPETWFSVNHTRTDVFPFGATMSFGTGNRSTADEEVVVSVSGFIHGEALRMSSDVARGDGYVLADGPVAELPVSDRGQNVERLMESWLVALEAFLVEEAVACVLRQLGVRSETPP